MIIIGLVFAIIIAFFVILMIPADVYYGVHIRGSTNITLGTFHRNLDINYSRDNITYYSVASPLNATLLNTEYTAEISVNKNIYFAISPSYIYTNSDNSKINFSIKIHVYSTNCFINVNIPSGGKYYNICCLSENVTGNQILLSVSIKLNNLQKDSLLVIPISVNSCTKYLQIYIK